VAITSNRIRTEKASVPISPLIKLSGNHHRAERLRAAY
jgi:hypothetical protein